MIIYILIILQLLDLLTTVIALHNPKLKEGNGILKPIFDKFGVLPTLILVKGMFIALLYLTSPYILVEVLYPLSAFYVWVVYNNIKLIRNN